MILSGGTPAESAYRITRSTQPIEATGPGGPPRQCSS